MKKEKKFKKVVEYSALNYPKAFWWFFFLILIFNTMAIDTRLSVNNLAICNLITAVGTYLTALFMRDKKEYYVEEKDGSS